MLQLTKHFHINDLFILIFTEMLLNICEKIEFRSAAQSCPTLCDPMDLSTPGFPALHYLPALAHTNVHLVSDAIQPSHPLSSPSPH